MRICTTDDDHIVRFVIGGPLCQVKLHGVRSLSFLSLYLWHKLVRSVTIGPSGFVLSTYRKIPGLVDKFSLLKVTLRLNSYSCHLHILLLAVHATSLYSTSSLSSLTVLLIMIEPVLLTIATVFALY